MNIETSRKFSQEACTKYGEFGHRAIFINGCEYGFQYAVEKACEWLEDNMIDGEDCFENLTAMALDSSSVGSFVEQFRKAMEQ